MQSPYRSCLLVTAALLVPLDAPVRAAAASGALHVAPSAAALAEKRPAPEPAAVPEVLRLAPAAQVFPLTLKAIRTQPVAGGIPFRNGFARSGPERRVGIDPAAGTWTGGQVGALIPRSSTTTSWLGRFVVEGAYAFRIRLRDVALPKEARIWLYAGDVELGPFGEELLDPGGTVWLPPAPGPEVVVEVELPAGKLTTPPIPVFTTGDVMEIVDVLAQTSLEPSAWTDCEVDATCVSTSSLATIDRLREATARLSFVKGGSSYLCSGGLLNDKDPSGYRPYLLTANHCFDTQAAASSLVAYFDYRTDGCNGTTPGLWEVPSVAGATLLATSPVSDFTFVELSGTPAGGNWYLGWTNADPATGSSMERVSHPQGTAQKYSASSFTGSAGIVCSGFSPNDFHYSAHYQGSTTGGSSGSPVTQDYGGDPLVVGQLFGSCHYQTWDECSYDSYNLVDGAFSATYPYLKHWINDLTGCSDSHEPNDSAAAASSISTGSPQSHGICPPGDEDWITFSLGGASAVAIETSGPAGDTRMWLYDGSLTLVESDDDGGTGSFSRIERLCDSNPLPAGTYYVMVEEYLGDEEIGEYQISYSWLESCDGSCPADLALSNDTISGSGSYRAGNSITVGPSLVIDGTAIDLLAGGRVTIHSGTTIGGSFSAGTDPAACWE